MAFLSITIKKAKTTGHNGTDLFDNAMAKNGKKQADESANGQ